MKQSILAFTALALAVALAPVPALATQVLWHQDINRTSIDLGNGIEVLASPAVDLTGAGTVVVQFNGLALASPGDRVLLAASDTPSWAPNDGHVAIEVPDTDVNSRSFSHTRAYDVGPGAHTFYAVVTRAVETSGSGLVSVYGAFTVTFYPDGGAERAAHAPVVVTNRDLRGSTEILASEGILVGSNGQVRVRFDGYSLATPGDRILLAASDDGSWGVNDGNVNLEVIDSDVNGAPFSHTRTYPVGPGLHTFYAVGQNFVETDGDGIASVYGSLTLEFVPTTGTDGILASVGISATNEAIDQGTLTLADLTIEPQVPGFAVVQFDGMCISDVGDRVVLAASDMTSWQPNSGLVMAEAYSVDVDRNGFSHTRVYPVTPGTHTFYALKGQGIEDDGLGIASTYGTLTVRFLPFSLPTSVGEALPAAVALQPNFPNPFNPATTIGFSIDQPGPVRVTVHDAAGRLVRTLVDEVRPAGPQDVIWQGRNDRGQPVASGVYLYRIEAAGRSETRTMVLTK